MNIYRPYDELASGLRDLRIAAGKTQEEVAEALGVQASTISRWESGHHQPTRHHLNSLEDYYGLEFGVLVERFLNLGARKKLHGRWQKATDGTVQSRIGNHTLELQPDGSLIVNGNIVVHKDGNSKKG